MSNSNIFDNSTFQQTPLKEAYEFNSFSQYISNGNLKPTFSLKCIFCSSINSTSLINDGSFRQCNTCKKNFKAIILR